MAGKSSRPQTNSSNRPTLPQAFPWHPVEPTKSQARAIKALADGSASEVQQKSAMAFIVNRICGIEDMEFRPEEFGGDRASCFAGGKRFVGNQIRKWLFATGEMIEALPEPLEKRTG